MASISLEEALNAKPLSFRSELKQILMQTVAKYLPECNVYFRPIKNGDAEYNNTNESITFEFVRLADNKEDTRSYYERLRSAKALALHEIAHSFFDRRPHKYEKWHGKRFATILKGLYLKEELYEFIDYEEDSPIFFYTFKGKAVQYGKEREESNARRDQ